VTIVTDSPDIAAEYTLAGRGMRLLGFVVDSLLFIVVSGARVIIRAAGYDTLATVMGTCLLLALAGLQIWLLATRGQTPGKILTKMAIVDPVTGFPPGFLRAAVIRQGPQTLLSFVYAPAGLAYLLVDSLFIFSSSRRCLHDRLADTTVIRVGRDWS